MMNERSFRSGTADLEMLEMNETGKGSNESWDIRSGVEERWVLVGEEARWRRMVRPRPVVAPARATVTILIGVVDGSVWS